MTTIVGVQGPGWAVIGYDSRVVEEGGRSYVLGRGSAKVIKNGPYLLGAAGDVRAINILAYSFTPPKPAADLSGVRLDRFMTSKFVPALRECFEDLGYAPRETREQAHHGSIVLATIHGQIYEIGDDYAWVRDTTGIYSCGSGAPYALGAMYASAGENLADSGVTETQRVIRDALSVASRLDVGTGPPFHVVTQSAPRGS